MTRSPVAAPMGLAVSVVRPVSLAYSASTRSRASRPASARACPRPSSVSGLSAWYPCTRPSRFHCVSPWRMRITRASATTRPQPTVEQPPARAGRLGEPRSHSPPIPRDQSPRRQLARRAQPLVEIPPQPEPRHFLGETLDPVLVHADAGAAVTKPQRAHQVVERLLPPRLLPNRQIEAQRDEAALDVVAHGGVRRILVLAVVLDPRVEARFGEALLRPARRAQMRGDRAPEQLEIVLFPDQPAPDQRKIVVVGGDALERPEELRVALAVEVV